MKQEKIDVDERRLFREAYKDNMKVLLMLGFIEFRDHIHQCEVDKVEHLEVEDWIDSFIERWFKS